MPKTIVPTRNPSINLRIKTDDPIPDRIMLKYDNCEAILGRVRVKLVDTNDQPVSLPHHELIALVKGYKADHAQDFSILRRNICAALSVWQFTGICGWHSDSD